MHPHAGGVALSPVLVGRDDLVSLGDRRIGAVRGGTGHLMLLAGEAGIGKTRLLTTIGQRAAAHGFTVVTVGAYPRDGEVAGGLLADLATALRPVHAAGARMVERLREGGGGDGDAYRQRRLLTADLAEIIVSVGGGPGPVLLALEDLQWADDLTLDVLERVARGIATVPVLIVGTYRSDELYPAVLMRTWRTRLLTQRLAEEARLSRLGPDGTAAMAAAIAGTALPAAVTAAVHERSDGIPLHVEEFLALISGSTPGAVPDTLADAVLARADALSPAARALAETASVIGRSFDIDLLTAITSDTPDGIDAALRELHDRFFVEPRGDGPAYDFRHALIRDALYAHLSPHRRRDLHARVAAAAAEAGFRDAFISDHFERAHQPAAAYRHALAAAADATAISAHREAVESYRRAERTAPSDTTTADRADLLVALAGELAAIDDNTAAAGAYAEAYAIRTRLGDGSGAASLVPDLVAVRHLLGADLGERTGRLRAALDSVGSTGGDVRPRILAALAAAYMLDRRLDESIEYGERARAAASGDRAARLNTDVTLGSVLVFAGRMDEGWHLLESAIGDGVDAHLEAEAARAYRMLGSSASVLVEYDRALGFLRDGIAYAGTTERFNDRHYMAAHLAHVQWATGDWANAATTAEQALADGGGGVTTRIAARYVLGYLALGRSDWPAATIHLDEARQLGEQMGELQRVSPAWWGLAEVAYLSGDVAGAVAWCERGFAASAEVSDAAYLFPYLVTGTRAYLAQDDITGARDWVERGTRLIMLRSIPGTMPALDHARGLLHIADGHTGQAREALARASAGWDERHRFWEGTAVLLDRAYAAERSRRPAEASTLIAEAHRRAAPIDASALLTRSAVAEPDGGTQPLTPREIEVARLIATGATNRRIAEALFISPKTVAAHVEHILAKLGAERRTEIATWATTH